MIMPWNDSYFWLISIGFIFITGLLAGSYPAFYLSSFKPVKVLKEHSVLAVLLQYRGKHWL